MRCWMEWGVEQEETEPEMREGESVNTTCLTLIILCISFIKFEMYLSKCKMYWCGLSENLKKVALSCVWALSSCQRQQATSLTCFWYFIFAMEKFILVESNYVKVWSLVSLVTSVVLGQVGA